MLFKSLNTGIRSDNDKQRHSMVAASIEVKAKKVPLIKYTTIHGMAIF